MSYNALHLNSSHPKNKLYANDIRINNECRACEDWAEKDIFYVIGHIQQSTLKELSIIDGMCYAADKSIYTRYEESLSNAVNQIPDIEFTTTKELAKINRADPLGITYLRIRGMWGIEHPKKVFNYLNFRKELSLNLYCILRKKKYDQLDNSSKQKILTIPSNNLYITDDKVKNPNNTAKTIEIKLLHYER